MKVFISFFVILIFTAQISCNYDCKNAINMYIYRRSLGMVVKSEEDKILKYCNLFNFDDTFKRIQLCDCTTTSAIDQDKPIQVIHNYMTDFNESDKINCKEEYDAILVATDRRNYDDLPLEYEKFYLCKQRLT
ncbi:uncharacterized protein LOC123011961 [Tribolium madens]|uniref:uncharacterized protein LOC123011961 n=1 Tax=Tribolium madens TaxID=41895 RepID=UPI001CF741E9|nr:uncharacterized protein LOC123011961 [Tribolium madens]